MCVCVCADKLLSVENQDSSLLQVDDSFFQEGSFQVGGGGLGCRECGWLGQNAAVPTC